MLKNFSCCTNGNCGTSASNYISTTDKDLYQCKKFLKREENQIKVDDNKVTLRTTVQLTQDEYMSSFKSTTLELSKSFSSSANEENLCNNPSYTTILNSTPNSIHFYHPKSMITNRPPSISNQQSIATVTANDELKSKSPTSIPADKPIFDEPIKVPNENQAQNKTNIENSNKHLSQPPLPPLPPTQPPSLSDTYEKTIDQKLKRANLLNLRKASLFRNSKNITIDSNSHKLVTSTPIISIPKAKLDAKLVKSTVTSSSNSNQNHHHHHIHNHLKAASNSVDLYESISTSINNFEKKNKKLHEKLNSKLSVDKRYDFIINSNKNHRQVDNNTYYFDDVSKNETNKILIGVKEELNSDLSEISLNSKENSVVLLKKSCDEAISQMPETCANDISGQEEYFPYQVCNPNKQSKEVVEKKELPKISLKHLIQKSLALTNEAHSHGTTNTMTKEKAEEDMLKKESSIDQRHKVKVKLKKRNDSSSSNHRCKPSDAKKKEAKNSTSANQEKKESKATSEAKTKNKTACKHSHHHHHHHHQQQQQQQQHQNNHPHKNTSTSN